MIEKDLSDLRYDYNKDTLKRSEIPLNPFALFDGWFSKAEKEHVGEANAMVLSTVSSKGRPSSRMVLLKSYDEEGLVFYTNYNSLKGQHISGNNSVCVLFYWHDLQRQIRIEGIVQRISSLDSDTYFANRPRQSMISAVISPQSRKIPDREYLDKLVKEFKEDNKSSDVKRPPEWGGYRIIPVKFEFWQGRKNRLHDRIEYIQQRHQWHTRRLAP